MPNCGTSWGFHKWGYPQIIHFNGISRIILSNIYFGVPPIYGNPIETKWPGRIEYAWHRNDKTTRIDIIYIHDIPDTPYTNVYMNITWWEREREIRYVEPWCPLKIPWKMGRNMCRNWVYNWSIVPRWALQGLQPDILICFCY